MNEINSCSHCGKCTPRCVVLSEPSIDIGMVQAKFDELEALDDEARAQAIANLLAEDYALYNALRQCCFCGYCTQACKSGLKAPFVMRQWRKWFMDTSLISANDNKLIMVDNEWNIFSAYRAIYDISYPEFTTLAQAAENGPGLVDTLFFPGCSLVSYAPEVVRALGEWLNDNGINWAIASDCCGSPLMSAGLFERAEAFRAGLVAQMQKAGIKKLITVCPGCAEELQGNMPEDIEIVPLPELLLEQAQKNTANSKPTGFTNSMTSSVTFFDSCHDREDLRNANALRQLFKTYYPDTKIIEMQAV